MTLWFEKGGETQSVTGDVILVATGRGAVVDDLGLERDRRRVHSPKAIATDATRRTSVPHIYAVGDVAGYWQLAHTAFREGEVAAENIAGHHAEVDGRRAALHLHRPGGRRASA